MQEVTQYLSSILFEGLTQIILVNPSYTPALVIVIDTRYTRKLGLKLDRMPIMVCTLTALQHRCADYFWLQDLKIINIYNNSLL